MSNYGLYDDEEDISDWGDEDDEPQNESLPTSPSGALVQRTRKRDEHIFDKKPTFLPSRCISTNQALEEVEEAILGVSAALSLKKDVASALLRRHR